MATPFDKLTSNDLTLIENYIKDYVVDAEYDTNLHGKFAGVENILAPWNRAKPTLFKLFGEELILSKELSFAMTREELYRQITDLLYSNPFMLKVREAYYNQDISENMLLIEVGSDQNYYQEVKNSIEVLLFTSKRVP